MAATAAVYNRLHNSSVMSVGVGGSGGGGGGHHSQLARSLERILEEAHLSCELILTNRKLKDFPKTATKYNLTDTVIADLSRNRFCELPEEVTAFFFLETLLLYHNTIRSIPESVKHLTSLTYLDLRSNQLSTLPREICFLPLQVLLVSNNRLIALPDELGRMDRLMDLDASYNQLSALPARIGELHSLRSLSLRSNQLAYLPRELTCLTLVSLDISNNRIASLPLEIRLMSTLVEFHLENNPLTSPPASLCVRGLVHIFKFLDIQATKDEKGSRAGGNYDGYTTLRRAPRHNCNGNALELNRVPRHHVDSGYSTCDGIDKRWSHDIPSIKPKSGSPIRKTPTTPPSSLSSNHMDGSLSSSTSTIVDEPLSSSSTTALVSATVLKSNLHNDAGTGGTSPFKQRTPPHSSPPSLHHHINYAHSNSSNGSSPDQDDMLGDTNHSSAIQNYNKTDERLNKNFENIQTYREYKEALKQQRNQEISSVYKIKGQKTLYDMGDATNALNCNTTEMEPRCNGIVNSSPTSLMSSPLKSIMKNGTIDMETGGGHCGSNGGGANAIGVSADAIANDDCVIMPKKPIQKVIPSRNTELSSMQARLNTNEATTAIAHNINGDCLGGYVKPNSPMKTLNGGMIATNINGSITPTAIINKFANGSGVSGVTAVTGGNGGGGGGGVGGLKSPVLAAAKLAATKNRVTWNHDIPPDKLSFTMRREFDRQREETELMSQLRSIIETRLKMSLPEDIASALTDGVVLCHLANYVRPRSVASIHVPSPGVSKLTMARCRRNVDNFLEACRKIGVDEELICSCADVVPPFDNDDDDNNDHDDTNNSNYNNYNNNLNINMNNNINNNNNNTSNSNSNNKNENNNSDNNSVKNIEEHEMKKRKFKRLRNPSAILKTVSALVALDNNPHHQNVRNFPQIHHHNHHHHNHHQQQQQQQHNHHYHHYQQQEQQQQHEKENNRYQQQQQQQQQPTRPPPPQQQQHQKNYQSRYMLDTENQQQKQQNEQSQQTATATKNQQHEQHIVANMEFNSTLNIKSKCHFENTIINGNNDTIESNITHNNVVDANNSDNVNVDDDDDDDDDDEDEDNVNNIDIDDVDNIVGFKKIASKNVQQQRQQKKGQQQQRQQQQQHVSVVGNLLRNAKLKTFQKIKLNLISTHGNNNNHCSMLTTATTTTLQTIIETENDVSTTTTMTTYNGDGDHILPLANETDIESSDEALKGGGGAYHLINERSKQIEVNSKYKLLELPTLELSTAGNANNNDGKIVSKRIEFFEHSANVPIVVAAGPSVVAASVAAKAKMKNGGGIFSIYRVAENGGCSSGGGGDITDTKLVANVQEAQPTTPKACAAPAKETGFALLKHDSNMLTVILSCIFIGTFLLLVFFPLPG